MVARWQKIYEIGWMHVIVTPTCLFCLPQLHRLYASGLAKILGDRCPEVVSTSRAGEILPGA
jgi:hypothetical protein